MNFGQAIEALNAGQRVCRDGWNGDGLWLCMVKNWNGNFGGDVPPNWSVRPFIAIRGADDSFAPWTESQVDALADDWRIADTGFRLGKYVSYGTLFNGMAWEPLVESEGEVVRAEGK